MTKTIQTIADAHLNSVTGGKQVNVNVADLLSALSGGPKTKDAAKAIGALKSLGVR